jgi:hypothetical protein
VQKTYKRNIKIRYLDFAAIVKMVGHDVCHALPGLHTFNGCDLVSAFIRCGKKRGGLDLVMTIDNICQTMQQIDNSLDITDEEYACAHYGKPVIDVNDLIDRQASTNPGLGCEKWTAEIDWMDQSFDYVCLYKWLYKQNMILLS